MSCLQNYYDDDHEFYIYTLILYFSLQSMVKKAPTFPAVLRRFEAWLKSYGLALNNQEYGHSFAIVTDGKQLL